MRSSGRSRWSGNSGMRCRWRYLRIIGGVGSVSVMMSYERAALVLPFLGLMFEMPVVVVGVGV